MFESEGDLLDIFLSTASEELGAGEKQVLKETNIFISETNINSDTKLNPQTKNHEGKSLVHSGDTDSSDEEGNRNYQEAKYNESGKVIKKLLNSNVQSFSKENGRKATTSWKDKSNDVLFASSSQSKSNSFVKTGSDSNLSGNIGNKKNGFKKEQKSDVYMDPIFGIRIVNPLISSSVLQDRMMGRDAISFAQLAGYLRMKQKDKDWVIAGAIVNKSAMKTSKKGNQFLIWTLSDLKTDIKTVSIFLFGSACKELWKTVVGTVVGVLNPNIMDKKDGSTDVAVLSVDNPQRVMIFGTSKDFGTCKSIKKNGEKCTSIVNKTNCEFCIYHIKQEYQKCSVRSELQSNFSGKGLIALRNKVLGKNEVFYAGKSYTAIPAKRSKKLEQRDNNLLQSLFGNGAVKTKNRVISKKKQSAAKLEISHNQRQRDLELMKKLAGPLDIESKNNFTGTRSSELTLDESKSTALSVISKLKNNKEKQMIFSPLYDRSSDLIVNIENKNSFNNKVSQEMSLDESKSKALNVIERLKKQNNDENPKDSVIEDNDITHAMFEDPLNYDDDNNVKSKNSLVNDELRIGDSHLIKMNQTEFEQKKDITKNDTTNSNDHKNKSDIKFSSSLSNSTFPTLNKFGPSGFLDLNSKSSKISTAKLKAIKFVQEKGPLKKADPNNIKGSGKKRTIEETETSTSKNVAKKSKLADSDLISDRFKKMMAATSKHADLLEARDDEEQEKYFHKQEMKEKMEEKMANTFKVACKAVRCLKCKYTSFSASDFCKKEGHPLKVFDTMKRFFKCGNCGNRTVSLEIIPTAPCKNCGSSKWEKTGMMKEKIATAAHTLSIRGGEQKYVNSVVTEANLNLMVPDE